MNKVSVVRPGTLRNYLKHGIREGGVLTKFGFLLFLIWNSIAYAVLYAFCIWVSAVLLSLLVFLCVEYIDRKMKLKKLYSNRYSFLDLHGFTLHEDLYFTGQYKGYWIQVSYMTQWRARIPDLEYIVIESYYQFAPGSNTKNLEQRISGQYRIGKLHFANQCVGYIPYDYQNPNFEEHFNELTSILRREHLMPLSLTAWEELYSTSTETKRTDNERVCSE